MKNFKELTANRKEWKYFFFLDNRERNSNSDALKGYKNIEKEEKGKMTNVHRNIVLIKLIILINNNTSKCLN